MKRDGGTSEVDAGRGWTRRFLFLAWTLVLASCASELPSAPIPAPTQAAAGFTALIDSAYDGEVSGEGVLSFLPRAGVESAGYYFLADGQGIRPHGVTFVLPPNTAVGHHDLSSPSVFDLGAVPSVRVDRDLGDMVVSYDKDTSGFIELTAFPQDATSMAGDFVEGSFQFETGDSSGNRIRVSGEFAFEVR